MALPTLPGLDPEYADRLVERQAALQAEAGRALARLGLAELLSQAGQVVQNGSSVAGLMVWRDLDCSVLSPGLTRARGFQLLLPLLTDSEVSGVRYLNQAGSFTFEERPENERFYVTVYY